MLPIQVRQSNRFLSHKSSLLSTFFQNHPFPLKKPRQLFKYNAFTLIRRFAWKSAYDPPEGMRCKGFRRSIQSKSDLEPNERTLRVALEKNQLELAIQIYQKLRRTPTFVLTESVHTVLLQLLKACSHKLHRHVTLDLYRLLRNHKQPIPTDVYNAVLSALNSKGDGTLALQIYQEMLSHNIVPNINSLNLLLQKSELDSAVSYALEEFSRVGVCYNATTYSELISKYLGVDYDRAIDWYKKMEESGYHMEDHLYHRIIQSSIQLGNLDLAHSAFESLIKHQRPTLPTLSLMILEHCRFNRMAEASHYFHIMRKHEIQSTPQIYQAMIDGFLRQADLESAIGVYSHMCSYKPKSKIAPDTYTRMIAACTKNQDMQTAKWLFDEMNRRGVNINEYTYSVMIAGYGQARNGPGVNRMYEAIRLNSNIEPDIGLYNTLLNAYNWVGDIGKVLQLYDSMKAGCLTPNNATISILLDACGRYDALYRAQVIWNRLQRQNFPLNCNNYTSYIEALGRNGQSQKAVELIKDMEIAGIRPDLKLFSTLLSFLKRDGHNHEIQILVRLLHEKYPNLYNLLEPKIFRN